MASLSETVRQAVFERSAYRCEYCQTARRLIGMPLVVDHVIPRARDGGDDPTNLCASCYRCNEFKGARTHAFDPLAKTLVPLYNPRTQRWSDHFQWEDGGIHIAGKSAIGRATVVALRLNNEHVGESRLLWVLYGWHPPQSE
ncbi:MAG: HNH endonuclease signature motif containing protein [Caldilineaceae bacterium]